ncbi:hypothetical protein JG687_00007232, partial [Phytophthora cactorum]
RYKDSIGVFDTTICRALRFDLKLTRKLLIKRARESVPRERREYAGRLTPFYSGPDQLVFIDETSKVGRSVLRRYGWAARNTPARATLSFRRGKCVSVLAAMDVQSFFTWGDIEDTFTRASFHDVFKSKILPYLNPWPLPRSIVVMDKAKIHMYKELQDMIHETGALLFFPPPYSPDLNPIEVGLSLLKRWNQRHGYVVFHENPLAVLRVAMYYCTRQKEEVGEHLNDHYLLITLHCIVHCRLLRIYLLKLSKCRVVRERRVGLQACVTAM